jgi:hypothetical protein
MLGEYALLPNCMQKWKLASVFKSFAIRINICLQCCDITQLAVWHPEGSPSHAAVLPHLHAQLTQVPQCARHSYTNTDHAKQACSSMTQITRKLLSPEFCVPEPPNKTAPVLNSILVYKSLLVTTFLTFNKGTH